MFIRKLYYDLTTLNVIESHMRQGDVITTTSAQDYAVLPSLQNRTDADTGVLVWTAPDATTEALFATKQCLSVTVDGESVTPVFTGYPEPEQEAPGQGDPYEA